MASQNLVNIGSGNGLLPEDIRPFPEPKLTYHYQGCVAFTWEKIQWVSKLLFCVMSLKIIYSKSYSHISQDTMS